MVMYQGALLAVFFAVLLFPFFGPLTQRLAVLGVTRDLDSIVNIHGEDFRVIPDTVQCEDLHLHEGSGMLFTACQGSEDPTARLGWFPPLLKFNPDSANQGSLHVVDPKTFTSQKLTLSGFTGQFVTHGIDIITDPDDSTLLHIFVVNHLPDPLHWGAADLGHAAGPNKTASQIEVFRYRLGSSTAEYVRSIRDPLIKTPNDIFAISPTEFYVTNDHYYREGDMRIIEELLTAYLAGWSDILHVAITDPTASNPSSGTHTTYALTGLHNNNGLGRSSTARPEEVLIVDASGGVLTRAWRSFAPNAPKTLNVVEHIQYDTSLDNPFFYNDPWATPDDDASGYVMAGLPRMISLAPTFHQAETPIPCTVWYSRRTAGVDASRGPSHKPWPRRIVFQDDGTRMRTASTAVMIGIDPIESGGRKMAWLYVTGFGSTGIVATKVDLSEEAGAAQEGLKEGGWFRMG